MDKPAKENTVSEVVRRIGHSLESLATIEEMHPEHNQLRDTFTVGLTTFFRPYDIGLPLTPGSIEHLQPDLEQISQVQGQIALNAIEGVARLATKVVWHTYENQDPKQYVSGLFSVLSGLPLEQLSSTPDKLQVGFADRTLRDRISDLLSISKEQEPTHRYMLNLLTAVLPLAADQLRGQDQMPYSQFLDQTLTYLGQIYDQNMVSNTPLPDFKTVMQKLSSIEAAVVESAGEAVAELSEKTAGHANGSVPRLTREKVAELVLSTDPKGSLEEWFGSAVLAVGYAGAQDGGNREVTLAVAANGSFVKHSVYYGSIVERKAVVDSLLKIRDICRAEIRPGHELYQSLSPIMASGRHLLILGQR